MKTLKDLTYEVRRLAGGGNVDDQSTLTDRAIWRYIAQARAHLLMQHTNNGRYVSDQTRQDAGIHCLEIVSIPKIKYFGAGYDIYTDGLADLITAQPNWAGLFRCKVPETLSFYDRTSLLVADMRRTCTMDLISHTSFQYKLADRFMKNQPRCFLIHDYLYVYLPNVLDNNYTAIDNATGDPLDMQYSSGLFVQAVDDLGATVNVPQPFVRILGVFAYPEDANLYNSGGSFAHVNIQNTETFDPATSRYPIPSEMEQPLIQKVLQDYMGVRMQTPNDTINNFDTSDGQEEAQKVLPSA